MLKTLASGVLGPENRDVSLPCAAVVGLDLPRFLYLFWEMIRQMDIFSNIEVKGAGTFVLLVTP